MAIFQDYFIFPLSLGNFVGTDEVCFMEGWDWLLLRLDEFRFRGSVLFKEVLCVIQIRIQGNSNL